MNVQAIVRESEEGPHRRGVSKYAYRVVVSK